MPSLHARCPHCGTLCRLDATALRAARGQVRCGRCREVFDGVAALEEPVAPKRADVHRAARGPAGEAQGTSAPAHRRLRVPIALRNLFRQGKRTALALSAIGFGVVALLLAGGFIEWIFWAMREATIQSSLGHLQVARAGYFEEGSADPFRFLLPAESEQLRRLEGVSHVRLVAPRLSFVGLISHGETTVSFLGEGVDPEKERILGKYLGVSQGEPLTSEEPNGVILGAGLAQNLGVKPGDTVVLLGNTAAGGFNGVEARVRGLFVTANKAFDDAALRVPIGLARELLRVSGSHTWVFLLEDTRWTDSAVEEVEVLLAGQDPVLEVRAWQQLADFYTKTVRLFSRQMDVVRAIIGLIIVLSISNVLIMSVLERTGEVGTLMALGLKRRRVLGLFLTEGAALGLLGGLGGAAVGTLLGLGISAVGIPMPPPPGMEMGFTGEIRLTPSLVVEAAVLAFVTTLLASLYPAWKASRLQIVDALRHNR